MCNRQNCSLAIGARFLCDSAHEVLTSNEKTRNADQNPRFGFKAIFSV